jgi:hypothetical protein
MTPDGWGVECSEHGCDFSSSGAAEAKFTFQLTDADQDELYRLFRENTTAGNHDPPTGPRPLDAAQFSLQVRWGTQVYNNATGAPFASAVMRHVNGAIKDHEVLVSFDFDKSLAGRPLSATVCGHSVADRFVLAAPDGGASVLSATILPGACAINLYFDDKTKLSQRVTVTTAKTFAVHSGPSGLVLE